MCKSTEPIEPEPEAGVETFESVKDFLDAIHPGMDLCTSDFTGWADIQSVQPEEGDQAGFVVGRVRESGATVHVPGSALIDLRHGKCVRLDRVRATVNSQGWEVD